MDEGFITLQRKVVEWEWFKDQNMFHLFAYLILKANHKDGNFKGIPIKRGQLLTGRNSLSENTGISTRSIRTCLNKLKSTNEIAIKSTSKYSIITVCKYNDYQNIKIKPTNKTTIIPTNERPSTDQVPTTNNNVNNLTSKTIKYIHEFCPQVLKMKIQLTEQEAESLEVSFDFELIKSKLDAMDNKADLLKSYVSVYKTLKNWCKMGQVSGNGQIQEGKSDILKRHGK